MDGKEVCLCDGGIGDGGRDREDAMVDEKRV